jgi:hypothetical protein
MPGGVAIGILPKCSPPDSTLKARPALRRSLSDDRGTNYSAPLRSDDRKLQMMGSAAQHREAIAQKPERARWSLLT